MSSQEQKPWRWSSRAYALAALHTARHAAGAAPAVGLLLARVDGDARALVDAQPLLHTPALAPGAPLALELARQAAAARGLRIAAAWYSAQPGAPVPPLLSALLADFPIRFTLASDLSIAGEKFELADDAVTGLETARRAGAVARICDVDDFLEQPEEADYLNRALLAQ